MSELVRTGLGLELVATAIITADNVGEDVTATTSSPGAGKNRDRNKNVSKPYSPAKSRPPIKQPTVGRTVTNTNKKLGIDSWSPPVPNFAARPTNVSNAAISKTEDDHTRGNRIEKELPSITPELRRPDEGVITSNSGVIQPAQNHAQIPLPSELKLLKEVPPVLPITPGQVIMLDALLLKIGWDRATLQRRTSKLMEKLTRNEARRWIAWLNEQTKGKVSAALQARKS